MKRIIDYFRIKWFLRKKKQNKKPFKADSFDFINNYVDNLCKKQGLDHRSSSGGLDRDFNEKGIVVKYNKDINNL